MTKKKVDTKKPPVSSSLMIKHYDHINNTPAIKLIAYAGVEVIEEGFASGELVCNWDCKALVAFDADHPIGVIAYNKVDFRNIIWISLSYVEPARRQEGVYSALFAAMIKKAAELGVAYIEGGTHVDNKAMLEAMEATRRVQTFITTRYYVTTKDGEK